MATRPKRRMKYPPGTAFADPLGYVLDSIKPADQAEDGKWLLDVKMKNHSAVTEFVHGRGTKGSLSAILQMHNMARALLLNGFGVDLTNIILDSDAAIKAIMARKQTKNSYTLKASEIQALNALLELHDAQMEVCTVGDITKARNDALREHANGNCVRLSTKYLGEVQ